MKSRSALILLVTFIVLFVYLYYYEMPTQEKIIKEKEVKEKIFDFDKDKVTSFVFNFENEDIEFQKVEGKDEYIIVKPVDAKADNEVVNKFLSELKEVKYMKKVEVDEDVNLSDFKLVSPFYTITINLEDGSQKIFKYGDMNVTKDLIYVNRNDDDNIYLIGLDARNIVDLVLYDFRDKDIFKEEFTDLGQIQITRDKEEITLEKKDDGWIISKPDNYKADIVEVRALINNLKNLKAIKFPGDKIKGAEKCDFSKPDFSIKLTSLDGKIIDTIKSIKKGPFIKKRKTMEETEKDDCLTNETKDDMIETIYFQKASEKGTYLISVEDFSYLNKPLRDFRDKSIFTLTKDDVYKIEVFRDGKLLRLVRNEKDEWSNISIKENPTEYSVENINNIFNYLSFLQSLEFINNADMDDETYDFKNSILTLSFYDKDGKMIEKLVTGKEEDGNIFLQRFNDSTVYIVNKSFTERFQL